MPATIPAIFAIFLVVLLGMACGSFLNVCITRIPRGESVVRPRSHCRSCGLPIANRDNVPLLSWILLRARCRFCGHRISWLYPMIEAATSLLFLACWLKFGPGWQSIGWAILCFLLLGLAVMDAQTMLLPDLFTIPGFLLGVVFTGLRGALAGVRPEAVAGLRSAAWASLAAILAAGLLFLLLGLYWLIRRRQGIGMGDIKLVAMLAAWLGLTQTALVFFIAVVAGAAYGLFLIATHRSNEGCAASQLAIPFGAFLSSAGLYSIFLGERAAAWYGQLFR
jgi:leader peptidase (prepilin peptidase) / N-methyltransferase